MTGRKGQQDINNKIPVEGVCARKDMEGKKRGGQDRTPREGRGGRERDERGGE